MSLLHVERITKWFGTRCLFDIDSLTLDAGRAILLSGMNGAGKSTLLRILAGLESPTTLGAVRYAGRPVTLSPYDGELRRALAYVHQHPYLFDRSVADNIRFGPQAQGLPAVEVAARLDEALAWAGIETLRDRPARHLSGGEKQRVALARARALRPRILLLDEPTSSLDGQAREQVMRLIGELGQATKHTHQPPCILAVCHDRDLLYLPDVERWRLREGRLERTVSAD